MTRGNFTWIKEVKVIDENTVQIITANPFPAAAEQRLFAEPAQILDGIP